MQKAIWTKNGWYRESLTEEEFQKALYMKGINRFEEFEFINKKPTKVFTDILQELNTDSPARKIDGLSLMNRQIYDAYDRFYVTTSGALLKRRDISEQKDIGSEFSEEDPDIHNLERRTLTELYSKQIGLEELFLEEPENNNSIDEENHICNCKTQWGIDNCSIFSENIIQFANEEENNCNLEEIEESIDFNKNKDAFLLPVLRQETIDLIKKEKEKFNQQIVNFSEQQKDHATAVFHLKIEDIISKDVGSRIDSAFCGSGYKANAIGFDLIQIEETIDSEKSIKELRSEKKQEFIHRISSMTTEKELFGPREFDKESGRDIRKTGIYGALRELYNEDQALIKRWSSEVFEKERNLYITTKRTEKMDEETLRGKLWAIFDRKQTNIKPIYDEETGILIKKSVKFPMSHWDAKKMKAFEALHFTKKDWMEIYSIADIIKFRLKFKGVNPSNKSKIKETVVEFFKKIENLTDLDSYIKWTTKRELKDNKIMPSLMDHFSFEEENTWKKSCQVKKKLLMKRIFLANSLSKKFTSIEEIEINNIPPISCIYKNCDCMIYEKPKFYLFEENKGLLGVLCSSEEYPHINWLCDLDNIQYKTKEELCISR